MKNSFLIIAIILAIAAGAGGFFGGMQYQKTKTPSFNGTGGRGQFGMRNGMGRPNGMAVNGNILSADDKSITVQLPDGSSKIVLFGSNTQISKADAATTADLKTGQRVAVFGTTNSDGSITAANIQLNPIFRGMMSPNPSSR